ncbi:hypothetical protein MBELCI_2701 [Limimaricola cinnabarinus LL-001]|jgi:hypothetical protein|uniref:Uncharacterized protein n=1 Tax=Limimaricola cinnabarinus LL-001 TaxID=1337093 RepID=U3AG28_9RHOB|nr:hypothetical protein MBELCI_2701 [Limimaricola cinnabarinus LL-001]
MRGAMREGRSLRQGRQISVGVPFCTIVDPHRRQATSTMVRRTVMA